MAYQPHTPGDRERMLAALGIDSVDALFEDIPPAVRARGLDLPPPEPELVVQRRLGALAARNRVDLVSFLGAGVYQHHIPAAVDAIISRGEFATAYTPYQPEISQGTLQTIWEYQSLLSELAGLPVVSASHYDGATATAEAALMAIRATGRGRVLASRAIHRHFLDATRTYLGDDVHTLEELPTLPDGTTDLAALEAALADAGRPVAGVMLGQPNSFGILEPMRAAADLAHAAGALFVAVVEPVSLAVLASPGEYGADIAAGEGQPLGIAPQFGGPYVGVLAATEALTRQIPGRLVGRTTDVDGRRAYVMTLRARGAGHPSGTRRQQHLHQQALCALAPRSTSPPSGPHGLSDVAKGGVAAARRLERALAGVGIERVHSGASLNEFAVHVPGAAGVHAALLDDGILAGLPLATWYPGDPGLADALLVCATETTTDEDIDRFATALAGHVGFAA